MNITRIFVISYYINIPIFYKYCTINSLFALDCSVGAGAGSYAGSVLRNEFGHHLGNGDVGEAFSEANEIHLNTTGEQLIKAGPKY